MKRIECEKRRDEKKREEMRREKKTREEREESESKRKIEYMLTQVRQDRRLLVAQDASHDGVVLVAADHRQQPFVLLVLCIGARLDYLPSALQPIDCTVDQCAC